MSAPMNVPGSPQIQTTFMSPMVSASPPTAYTEVAHILRSKNQLGIVSSSHSISPSSSAHSVLSSEINPRPNFNVRILCGNGNRKLAKDIAKLLKIKLEDCTVGTFADGEINIHIKNNVRGSDVYIIQPTAPPDVNKNLMELLLLIHTLKLSSAKRITAIVPYYGYARQDRKTKPRVPISASVVAQLMEAMGPHRLITFDLHCGQIQGFFQNTPVDNLYAEAEMIKYIKSKNIPSNQLVIVSPDAGGVARARRAADMLGAEGVVTIMKRRTVANQVDSMQMVGDVAGFTCLLVDDMIDTAGTLVKAASLLKDNGAERVFAFATHGLLSGPALERINESVLEEVCVTDTLPQEQNLVKCSKLRVLTVAPLLVEVINRLHYDLSLASLYPEKS